MASTLKLVMLSGLQQAKCIELQPQTVANARAHIRTTDVLRLPALPDGQDNGY